MPKLNTTVHNFIVVIITLYLLLNPSYFLSFTYQPYFLFVAPIVPIVNLYWLKFTKNKSNLELLKQFLLFLGLYFIWFFGIILLASFTEFFGIAESAPERCGSSFCENNLNWLLYVSILILANLFLTMKSELNFLKKR